ncbi:MAG: YggS family pyridoxal phosphate-dependent enzyme, partial [Bacteroidales bacterium]|nr:YggS family pyridoxal phosphate-dependent enzyme [Bacteroidales bacterium]
MNHIIENIAQIRRQIEEAALGVGRNPDEVKLLLATKTVSAENIRIAIESGERLIGENRAQEIKS